MYMTDGSLSSTQYSGRAGSRVHLHNEWTGRRVSGHMESVTI